MDLRTLNAEMARALGVTGDLRDVVGITLRLSPTDLPTVSVERRVRTADSLQTAVEMLKLKPEAA